MILGVLRASPSSSIFCVSEVLQESPFLLSAVCLNQKRE